MPLDEDKAFEEFMDIIPRAFGTVKSMERRLKAFKPILDRNVLDAYPRIQQDGIIVKIEGEEIGEYWSKEEYDNDQKTK